jgi:hypothetical protein
MHVIEIIFFSEDIHLVPIGNTSWSMCIKLQSRNAIPLSVVAVILNSIKNTRYLLRVAQKVVNYITPGDVCLSVISRPYHYS